MKSQRYVRAGETLFLGPGEIWFGRGDGVVSTLLGSCVAMTLWHPPRRLAGMCHYVLPSRPASVRAAGLDGRYGDEAMRLLVAAAVGAGCDLRECELGCYGGGWMFDSDPQDFSPADSAIHIPQHNIAQAHMLMSALGINVVSEHVGGRGHRQVHMSLVDGRVRVTHTPRNQSRTQSRPGNRDIVRKRCG